MKRIGGLFDIVHALPTLELALLRAACGKRDRAEVRAFLANAPRALAEIGAKLRDGHFRFAPYRAFEVRDTKTRTIHAPTFADRVVHHAIIAATGATFERGAIHHSYACRTGKGQHAALAQARTLLTRKGCYGKIDVRRFYDSIHHDHLRAGLARRFREARLLALFDGLIDSYHSAPGRGLPTGALTSQYLGNFVLDAFDHAMHAAGYGASYLRYMDDALVFADATELRRVREAATSALAALGLEAKNGGEWNRVAQGVPFLGFVLYPGRTRVNRAGRKRYRRKLGHVRQAWRQGAISEHDAQARVTALAEHVRHGDDIAWRRTVLGFHDFDAAAMPEKRGAQGSPSGDPRRQLEQHGQEVPLRVSQQEEPG